MRSQRQTGGGDGRNLTQDPKNGKTVSFEGVTEMANLPQRGFNGLLAVRKRGSGILFWEAQ